MHHHPAPLPFMRSRLLAAAATAALAAVPTPAAAQFHTFAEIRAYAFNGCGFGGTCHRGVVRLYEVSGPTNPFQPAPDWLGIGWSFEHEFPANTAFSTAPRISFAFLATSGTYRTQEPDFYPGPQCPTFVPSPVARTCASYPMVPSLGPISATAWASPDWDPTAVQFAIITGSPDDPTTWERGTVTLAMTPTSVIPEPSTYVLLGAGLLGMGAVVRRRGLRA